MSFLDRVVVCDHNYGLGIFQILGVYCIFVIVAITQSEDILADNKSLGKVRYLVLHISLCWQIK